MQNYKLDSYVKKHGWLGEVHPQWAVVPSAKKRKMKKEKNKEKKETYICDKC
jgi:hypothetical protein